MATQEFPVLAGSPAYLASLDTVDQAGTVASQVYRVILASLDTLALAVTLDLAEYPGSLALLALAV